MKYYIEKGSGYEFGIEGDNVFITKSPKSSASREKPRKVKSDSKAYKAIKKFVNSTVADTDKQVQPVKTKADDQEIDQTKPAKTKADDQEIDQTKPVKTKADDSVKKEKQSADQEKQSSAYKVKVPPGAVKKEFSEFKALTWLDGDEDYIDAVEINGKDHFAIGYVRDTKTQKEGVAVKMTYVESQSLSKSSGKYIAPIMAPMKTIKPARGIHDIPYRRGKDIENYYLIPWGSSGVKIYVTMLNVLDGATIAAKAQEVLDFIGGIPVVGFVGDFSNMVVELIKPKPSYFNACLYALGALPMIGELLVIAKASKLIPKIAKKATANEHALRLASKMSGDVNTFQKIGKTIRGKGFVRKLVDYAEPFKKTLRGNFRKLDKVGVTIAEETIENFIKYFDEFVKAYKVYSQLTPIVMIGKFKNLVAIAGRPAMYIGNAATEEALSGVINKLDLYRLTNVKKTDNVFSDAVDIGRVLSADMENTNPETAQAIIGFANYLESDSFQSFLDTKPSSSVVAESSDKVIINEANLRTLVRKLL